MNLDKLIRMYELAMETSRAVKHGTMTVRVDELQVLLDALKINKKLVTA